MLETVEKPSASPLNSTSGFTLPEFVLPPTLPTDIDALTALLLTVVQANVNLKIAAQGHLIRAEVAYETRLRELYEQIVLMRRRMFGPSSESANQGRLFDEAEVLAATSTGAQDIAPLPAQPCAPQKKARGKRSPLPPELERIEIIHDVPESERISIAVHRWW